jgi:hypothetical protein
MTPESVSAAVPQPAGMGEFSRISGVFFEPAKTFEDVARRPSFLTPLLLVIVASLVFTTLYSQHVGWERTVRHQVETSSRAAQQTPEQREQGIQIGTKIAPMFGYGISLVGVPLAYLVCGAVLLVMVKIMSANVSFKQVFAVMCYAAIPGLIFTALAIVVMFLKNPDDFDIKNPLAFNPGALMDPATSSKFLYSLATSLDVFSAWKIILIAVGLKAAAGKTLSFTGALMAVLIPWAIWVLGSASLAGVFS